MIYDNIAKAFLVAGQFPLDAKTYFPTLAQLKDLGTANSKAFTYYEWMAVTVAENGLSYVWKEVDQNFTGGALDQNFQYPAGVLSNNIDYSFRYFNFVANTPPAPALVAKPYIIFKDFPTNQADFLEINDVVIGHFSPELFMTARYLGGPLNQPTSWAKLTETNPKAYV